MVVNKTAPFTTGGASVQEYGYTKSVRAEYVFSHNSAKYIDSTSSCPNY